MVLCEWALEWDGGVPIAERGVGEPIMVDFGLDVPIDVDMGPGDGDAPRANGFARLWAPTPTPFEDILTYSGVSGTNDPI